MTWQVRLEVYGVGGFDLTSPPPDDADDTAAAIAHTCSVLQAIRERITVCHPSASHRISSDLLSSA
jgi:hypothetical protein